MIMYVSDNLDDPLRSVDVNERQRSRACRQRGPSRSDGAQSSVTDHPAEWKKIMTDTAPNTRSLDALALIEAASAGDAEHECAIIDRYADDPAELAALARQVACTAGWLIGPAAGERIRRYRTMEEQRLAGREYSLADHPFTLP
jgi:hypothetical protein